MKKKNLSHFIPLIANLGAFCIVYPSALYAQSLGSFATRPYQTAPNATAMAQSAPIYVSSPPPNTIALPPTSHISQNAIESAPTPAPVVMFRQTKIPEPAKELYGINPNFDLSYNSISLPALTQENAPVTMVSNQIIPQAPMREAEQAQLPALTNAPISTPISAPKRRRHFWEPIPLPATPAPSVIPKSVQNFYGDLTMDTNASIDPQRGPMKAIVQDSSRALRRDLPQAIADTLPWVDNARKQEPFGNVLARVSDNLSRANAADPEWALPAQSEIRELATRLDRLSNPPQFPHEIVAPNPILPQSQMQTDRPFYARPIWPGSQPRAEAGIRPVAIISTSDSEIGAKAAGQNIAIGTEPNDAPKPETPVRNNRRRR